MATPAKIVGNKKDLGGDQCLTAIARWRSISAGASDYPALAIKAVATLLDQAGVALEIDESKPGYIFLKIPENKD
jgi:hypothetical protein